MKRAAADFFSVVKDRVLCSVSMQVLDLGIESLTVENSVDLLELLHKHAQMADLSHTTLSCSQTHGKTFT